MSVVESWEVRVGCSMVKGRDAVEVDACKSIASKKSRKDRVREQCLMEIL